MFKKLAFLLTMCLATVVWAGDDSSPSGFMHCTNCNGTGNPITEVPTLGTGGVNAVTVTNSSAQALAARTAPQTSLNIKNESTTASIAFCLGSSCTAAINTAGSVTIPPNQLYAFGPNYIPLDQINMISSVASSPATITSN